MIRRLLRSLAPALLLGLIAGQAWAEVTVTFYAHPGARIRGGYLLFMRGGGEVQEPDARYVAEGQPYLELTVDDATWHALKARAEWWNSPDGSVYDLRRRNCITFIADLARVVGLQTAPEPSMKPGTFLEATAALNPAAAWREEPALPETQPAPVVVISPATEPAL